MVLSADRGMDYPILNTSSIASGKRLCMIQDQSPVQLFSLFAIQELFDTIIGYLLSCQCSSTILSEIKEEKY